MSFNFTNPSKFFAWIYSLICPFYAKRFYRKLVEILQFESSKNLLDFGSGTGILAKKILKRLDPSNHLTCLDVSQAFINKTKKNLRKFENVDFVLGDIRNVKFPKTYFDKIFITWVIHHIPNEVREETLKKITNCLNLNGSIYVIEYVSAPHGIQKDDLNKLFNDLGFLSHEIYLRKNTILIEYNKSA